MLSKTFRLFRRLLAEATGALVLTVMVFGVFLAATLNEGAMRIIGPLLVIIGCFFFYWLTWLINGKQDRK